MLGFCFRVYLQFAQNYTAEKQYEYVGVSFFSLLWFSSFRLASQGRGKPPWRGRYGLQHIIIHGIILLTYEYNISCHYHIYLSLLETLTISAYADGWQPNIVILGAYTLILMSRDE